MLFDFHGFFMKSFNNPDVACAKKALWNILNMQLDQVGRWDAHEPRRPSSLLSIFNTVTFRVYVRAPFIINKDCSQNRG